MPMCCRCSAQTLASVEVTSARTYTSPGLGSSITSRRVSLRARKLTLSTVRKMGFTPDRAPSHRAHSLSELETTRGFLPSDSPELDPAERVFEEVRRDVEGKVYESIPAKQKEAERYLKELKADPERVKSLCCWEWLREVLESLPECAGNP